jgi:hypothetical protein
MASRVHSLRRRRPSTLGGSRSITAERLCGSRCIPFPCRDQTPSQICIEDVRKQASVVHISRCVRRTTHAAQTQPIVHASRAIEAPSTSSTRHAAWKFWSSIGRVLETAKSATSPASADLMICSSLIANMSRGYWNGSDMGLTEGEYNIVHLERRSLGDSSRDHDRMHYDGFVAGGGDDRCRGNVRSAIKRTCRNREPYRLRIPLGQTGRCRLNNPRCSFRPWAHSSMDCLMQQHPFQKLLDFSNGIRLGKQSRVFRCFTK